MVIVVVDDVDVIVVVVALVADWLLGIYLCDLIDPIITKIKRTKIFDVISWWYICVVCIFFSNVCEFCLFLFLPFSQFVFAIHFD